MIVLANGVFDLLHVGHIRYLEQAATWGDLIVGVTKDSGVEKLGRPIIPEGERLEMVRALACVTHASLCENSLEALTWEPDIFVKGDDYRRKGLLESELEFCRLHGIEIKFTSPNPQTTSEIIKRIKCAS